MFSLCAVIDCMRKCGLGGPPIIDQNMVFRSFSLTSYFIYFVGFSVKKFKKIVQKKKKFVQKLSIRQKWFLIAI